MTCIRLILLAALTASGCTTPPVQEDPDPLQATAAPCQTPPHLMRDLTVPWNLRTYVIAPCPGAGLRAMSTGLAPASSAVEPSASERLAP